MNTRPRDDELWDSFAPEADAAALSQMSVEVLARQIHELRAQEPDAFDLTDMQIACRLVYVAQLDAKAWCDYAALVHDNT